MVVLFPQIKDERDLRFLEIYSLQKKTRSKTALKLTQIESLHLTQIESLKQILEILQLSCFSSLK